MGLFGSTTGALLFLWKQKIQKEQILYVSLSGGIICGAIVNMIPYPSVFFFIGLIGSIIVQVFHKWISLFLSDL